MSYFLTGLFIGGCLVHIIWLEFTQKSRFEILDDILNDPDQPDRERLSDQENQKINKILGESRRA